MCKNMTEIAHIIFKNIYADIETELVHWKRINWTAKRTLSENNRRTEAPEMSFRHHWQKTYCKIKTGLKHIGGIRLKMLWIILWILH